MSTVTNIILLLPTSLHEAQEGYESPDIARLNTYLRERHQAGLLRVDEVAGGNKWMECDIWMGAYNFLEVDAFVAQFLAIAWEAPQATQLLLMRQDDDCFFLIVPCLECKETP